MIEKLNRSTINFEEKKKLFDFIKRWHGFTKVKGKS